MTIVDPPIKDNSEFYVQRLYQQPTHHGSELVLNDKEEIEQQSTEQNSFDEPPQDKYSLDQFSIKDKISRRRKWIILFIVALQGFLGPLSSSIYVPALAQVTTSFNTTSTAINATLSLYVFMMGLAPLLWASLSERHGRRAIYLLATLLYIASTIGCALTYNIALFIVLRALQSAGASAAQAVGAGTITDLFDMHERGKAMGLFLLGPLIGPVIGPIAGGFINEFLDWRWIFWLLTIMGSVILILILFFVPETSALILRRRWLSKNDISALCPQESILRGMSRPFEFIVKPAVILATTPYSIAYGFMYFVIASLPHELSTHYQFVSYQIGLAFLANGIGNALGAVISGKLTDRALKKVQHEAVKRPEVRLSPMWIGIVLLPVGGLMYGWFIEYNVQFMAPIVGLFLLGTGVGVVQTPGNTYIVDSYQNYSASVMSAANLLRCISAGCTPLVAPTLISTIGNGWSLTLLSIISLMSGFCIFLVQRYGQQWRNKG